MTRGANLAIKFETNLNDNCCFLKNKEILDCNSK